MEWQDGKTAPKNGDQFLADIGLKNPVLAVWGERGGFEFVYIYTKECKRELFFRSKAALNNGNDIKKWMPLPLINKD